MKQKEEAKINICFDRKLNNDLEKKVCKKSEEEI